MNTSTPILVRLYVLKFLSIATILWLATGIVACDRKSSATIPKPGADWPTNAAQAYEGIMQPVDPSRIAPLSDRADRQGITSIADELERFQPVVRQLVTASWIESSDWSAYTEGTGFGMAFPYLGWVRSGGVLLWLDAQRHLADGDTVAAADRLGAVVRLSRHASKARQLLPVILSLGLLERALDTVAGPSARDARWSGVAAGLLLDELRSLNADDPMGLAAAYESDLATIDQILAGTLSVPIGLGDEIDHARRRISGATPEELTGERERLRVLRSSIATINWSATDATARAQRAIDQAQLRIVEDLLPDMQALPNMVRRTSERLREAIATLESVP